jgi:hypothetical protein
MITPQQQTIINKYVSAELAWRKPHDDCSQIDEDLKEATDVARTHGILGDAIEAAIEERIRLGHIN